MINVRKLTGILLVLLVLTGMSGAMTVTRPAVARIDPVELVSAESILGYLEVLTTIQPYSGWRNSGSSGEQDAVDYVAATLGEMPFLVDAGMTVEQQDFNVLTGVDIWESRVVLTIGGAEIEVPADATRGERWDLSRAIRFDSDGVFNDADHNPVIVAGDVIFVRTEDDLYALAGQDISDKVLVVDFAVVDRSIMPIRTAIQNAWTLVDMNPAGILLVTQFSNVNGESHGAFVGDVSAFNWVESQYNPPLLYARIEDMAPAGITTWDDLLQVTAAQLTWDVDVFSPGQSRNLIAHIPGADTEHAVILGAHIDSPNTPGALDNGSGSAILLEVARVLAESETVPPTDIYLVWFGSHETGTYGSSYFVATHQDLLDRTIAMFNIDCLTHPLDGMPFELAFEAWSFARLGDPRLPWNDYMVANAAELGIDTASVDLYFPISDSTSFAGFGMPHFNLIYDTVDPSLEIHYGGQLHAPYGTVELARNVSPVLEDMARLAVRGALQVGTEQPDLRTYPESQGRAVLVGSKTEDAHLSPVVLTEFGMALHSEGLDVDMVPYGQDVTADDVQDAPLVIVLPSYDYPSAANGALDQYDVAWTEAEIEALTAYVEAGGMLVLVNSAHSRDFAMRPAGVNEDWDDLNALGEPFGITFQEGVINASTLRIDSSQPLMQDIAYLTMFEGKGVPFEIAEGQVLAAAGSRNVIAQVPYGDGEVVVIADLGILGAFYGEAPTNLPFWRNLGAYALGR